MVAATSFIRCFSAVTAGGSFFLSRMPPPSLSLSAVTPSISYHRIHDNAVTSRRRAILKCFCTAAEQPTETFPTVAVDDQTSGGTGSAGEEEEDEMAKIKEAANSLDIRVGKIVKAWRHEEADSLYVEEVDVGEAEPRIICSGLVKYVPLHHLQDINVVVLANLKPRNMRGVKSHGMLMAASDASHENVELLVPPDGSLPGQRIWFGNTDEIENLPDAASPNQIQKKKIWEMVQPHLSTDDSCIAKLGIYTMQTSGGMIVSRSLKNARIS